MNFLAYLSKYSARMLPFFWRHSSRSFTFFTLSYIQSPLLCEILYRPLPSYAACCHDKASVSSLVTTRWRSSLLFIHAFLGLLALVSVCLSGIYCFHLLTHPHPILQFTQPTWTTMWLSSLQPGDVPGCNMNRSLRWPTHSATYVSSQELGAPTSGIYQVTVSKTWTKFRSNSKLTA